MKALLAALAAAIAALALAPPRRAYADPSDGPGDPSDIRCYPGAIYCPPVRYGLWPRDVGNTDDCQWFAGRWYSATGPCNGR